MPTDIYNHHEGAIVTLRHPDGRVRSDFAMGTPTEAVRELLRVYPEPWKVVCISHPQTIYTDLQVRTDRLRHYRTYAHRPEARFLRTLGAKGRLA